MFAEIDWSRPWYASVRAAAAGTDLEASSVIASFSAQAAARELCNHQGLPLAFVPQSALPEGVAYEEFIGATGGVPTRDNLHDFFNGLVWLSFPLIKRQLNALQAAQIARDGVGKSRGPARDAATLFDENAALLVVRGTEQGRALARALRGHEWRTAFVELRELFGEAGQAQVWLFGHALMEKLVAPYKAITAHTRIVTADEGFFALDEAGRRAWLDQTVARELALEGLSKSCFTPLPMLGVPGWWPGQDEEFYGDAAVFRPKRSAQ
ncbi:DUF3025 domain-containing protein [Pseudoduganella namucuonensis]|uniref:DUF3025 domain-containing protein n=1 Tax=Pseudoduganella namucuonensis TaxID=1035707 RepID=A0A1I7LA33_9BURK|nr:DUF3025 domain-containing protein [Pseudoduganella namucuonensis]SFV06344.1 Protein of unknown function [Pseudoduganella namucuonensis]